MLEAPALRHCQTLQRRSLTIVQKVMHAATLGLTRATLWAVGSLLLFMQTAAQPQRAPFWYGQHGPDGMTRRVAPNPAITTSGMLRWDLVLPSGAYEFALGPTNVLYIATSPNLLLIDVSRGQLLKTIPLPLRGLTVGSTGVVYGYTTCGMSNISVVAIDTATETVLWNTTFPGNSGESPLLAQDGTLFASLYSNVGPGSLNAINTADGRVKWSNAWAVLEPVISAKGVIVAEIFGFASSTGRLLWTAASTWGSSPAVGLEDSCYMYFNTAEIQCGMGAVICSTGRPLWQTNGNYAACSDVAINTDLQIVYYGGFDSLVHAYDAITGQVVWQFKSPYSVSNSVYFKGSPAIGPDGTVYVGASDNHVYALSGKTGQLLWQYEGSDEVYSNPLIAEDGTVIAVSLDAHVYAFAPMPVPSPSPSASPTPSPSLTASGSLTPSPSASPSPTPQWAGYHGTDGRTRQAVGPVLPIATSRLALAWSTNASGAGVAARAAPAIDAAGRVFVGTDAGSIVALNGTGSIVWSFQTGNTVLSAPLLANANALYVGSDDGKVYMLDASSGAQLASYTTAGRVRSAAVLSIPNNSILVGSDDGTLYNFNGNTLIPQWTYVATSPINSSAVCTVDGKTVVVATDAGVIALSTVNGSVMWSVDTLQACGSPVMDAAGNSYVGTCDGKLYALALRYGAVRWVMDTNNTHAMAGAALGTDGSIVIVSSAGVVYSVNPTSGAVRWLFVATWTVTGAPAIATDNTVFVTSWDAHIYMLNGDMGVMLDSYLADDWIEASPAIGSAGAIFFSTDSGTVYKLQPVYPSPSPSPSVAPTSSTATSLGM